MSNDTTVTETERTGENTDVTTGNGDTATPNTDKQEKMLPQTEVNKLIAKARSEGRDSGRQALLKEYEGKHVFTDEERDAFVKAAIDTALKERDLVDVKRAIQTEYGLTDAQLAKLGGDDEKSLRADAETTFGVLKQKKAPIVNPGTTTNTSEEDSDVIGKSLRNIEKNYKRLS
jgi:hypothetical protein